MKAQRLEVLFRTERMGQVEQLSGGRLRFEYDADWRNASHALPLSISMPLTAAVHGHQRIEPFLQGLLPDNQETLRRWGRRYQVLERNAFALLSEVGEDCASAVQFVRPERVEALRQGPAAWQVAWLDEAELAQQLRALESDGSAWHFAAHGGRFSLAGAQPKTALLREDGRWGVPSGWAPTTHILKPPMPELDGIVENEHVCLSLARALGLSAARTEVGRFEDRTAIVVERYDRLHTGPWVEQASRIVTQLEGVQDQARLREARRTLGELEQLARVLPIVRLHQEDLCQALSVPPAGKNQSEGGPSPLEVVALLRMSSSRPVEDVWRFVDALALNWLIAGTDAHAKNYSILYPMDGEPRLAPLYDVLSFLPYAEEELHGVRMAMKVGSKYAVRQVLGRHWMQLARELALDADQMLQRVGALMERAPDAMEGVRARAREDGLDHPVVDRLAARIQERSLDCQRALEARAG